MATNVTFRPYTHSDREVCLSLFDANCPKFFAPNERTEYADFLDGDLDGYELCLVNGQVAGAVGLSGASARRKSLNWIMLNPHCQGLGVGSSIMKRVAALATAAGLQDVDIAASHKSATFFARFGAATTSVTADGWGPGMHRVDMELPIEMPQS